MLSINAFNLVCIIVNLLLLVVLMRIFLFKPVQKIIAERQQEADRQFAEAATRQSEAENLKCEYEKTLEQAEEEKRALIAEARKKADAEYKRIVRNAELRADELREKAASEATREKTQILKQAEKEIADMVVDAATKVIGEKKGADMDSALYNKFLDKAGDEA